jgi:DNA helicase HerA-like ATPase
MLIAKNGKESHLLPQMLNRHGLVAGSTGSGKTVTLQVMAENISREGVPVFVADIKGDLSGLAVPGAHNAKVLERVNALSITDFSFEGNPIATWDIFSTNGRAIKTTVQRMGALLLSRLLNLTDAQSSSLYQIFKIASDNQIILRNIKDLTSMVNYITNNPVRFESQYGKITSASYLALQRNLLMLEDSGSDVLFSSTPESFDINRFLAIDQNGRGVINILDATRLIKSPQVYATFLLWLLQEFYDTMPEIGDVEKPKIVFFFDEAHILFDEASKVFIDKIERMIKLVRSKGIGIFFVTQNPIDIPEGVLSQLGNRVQHAMRAYTPKEQKAVKTIAQTFRNVSRLNIENAIGELKIGEALVSFLSADGSPVSVERTTICPPRSKIGVK